MCLYHSKTSVKWSRKDSRILELFSVRCQVSFFLKPCVWYGSSMVMIFLPYPRSKEFRLDKRNFAFTSFALIILCRWNAWINSYSELTRSTADKSITFQNKVLNHSFAKCFYRVCPVLNNFLTEDKFQSWNQEIGFRHERRIFPYIRNDVSNHHCTNLFFSELAFQACKLLYLRNWDLLPQCYYGYQIGYDIEDPYSSLLATNAEYKDSNCHWVVKISTHCKF